MKPIKTKYEVGDTIAERYEVKRILGKGGMGVVYLAWDQEDRRQVALKTLLPQYATNKYAISRFMREVNAVRRLDHPAVVKIYDARRLGPLLFYTMEYVEGKSLRSWMQQRKRLGWGSTVRILALLADALEHAHQFTIHRDISPENVMVLADGSVRLLDFGLAKLTDSQAAFTQIGISLGKRQYNSPEQRASAAEVDHRADIYPLGVMFYEMLSGKLPKPGRRLTELVPGLPPECDAFVEKAMAQSPEDRFWDAREFRLSLMGLHGKYEAMHEQPAPSVESEAPAAEPVDEGEKAASPGVWDRIRSRLAQWVSFLRAGGARSASSEQGSASVSPTGQAAASDPPKGEAG